MPRTAVAAVIDHAGLGIFGNGELTLFPQKQRPQVILELEERLAARRLMELHALLRGQQHVAILKRFQMELVTLLARRETVPPKGEYVDLEACHQIDELRQLGSIHARNCVHDGNPDTRALKTTDGAHGLGKRTGLTEVIVRRLESIERELIFTTTQLFHAGTDLVGQMERIAHHAPHKTALVQELGKTPKIGMKNGVAARNVKVRLATDALAERLGLIDDLTSVTHGRSLGLTPHAKMIGLTIICVTFTVLAVNWCGVAPEIRFPGGLTIDLGVLSTTICGLSFPWLYIVFCWLMIAGLSNAVNLTDGLDGLAGGTSMIAMLAMAAMAFLHGDVNLSIFCTACAGACLGFLWFNCYPASIFMGDTGSLALGAAFACTSIMTNTEVVSLIIGGLFIVETLSVMIQVVYFHFTHKRVFLMAPIHHHFEKKGWAETKVVIRFWIIAAAFGAVGLALFFQLG